MADLNQVRRRADEFARLVDGAAPPPNPVQDPEFHQLVTLVEQLRDAGDVQPRPDFSASLRQRLVEEHAARITATPQEPDEESVEAVEDFGDDLGDDLGEDEVAEVTPLSAAPRHRRGRLIAGAAAFVVLAGGIGSAAAAQQSMPGDALYGLKRGLESVASKVSVTDDSRGRRDLSHALARLTEAEQLVTDKAKTGTITDTLGDFSTDARSGGDHLIASFNSDNDAAAIEKIYVFAAEAQRRLVALAPRSPAAVRPAAFEALRTVTDLIHRAGTVCPACAAPKTGATISPDSVKTSQNPTEPNNPTATEPEQSKTDLTSPDISIPPTVAPTIPPKVPTTGTDTTTPGLPSLPLPSLPTVKPSLPTVTLPTVGGITLPTVTVSVPLFNLGVPLPVINLPPLLPQSLRLPAQSATTTSSSTAKSASTTSAAPSKTTFSTPPETAAKTSPVPPTEPLQPVPTIRIRIPAGLPWPWFTTMTQYPRRTPTAPATPSDAPTSTPTTTS